MGAQTDLRLLYSSLAAPLPLGHERAGVDAVDHYGDSACSESAQASSTHSMCQTSRCVYLPFPLSSVFDRTRQAERPHYFSADTVAAQGVKRLNESLYTLHQLLSQQLPVTAVCLGVGVKGLNAERL